MEIFKQLRVNILLFAAIKYESSYVKFFKDLCS